MADKQVRLKNLPLSDVRSHIADIGEPGFRAAQVLKWVYQKRVDSFEQMRNVSKSSQQAMDRHFTLGKLPCDTVLKSRNLDAVKFGFGLVESADIAESVLLYDEQRRTACLSSQLGCGLGCSFCATGDMGFVRNLTQDEIIGQLVGINDYLASQNDKLVDHIVFMGMGEALSNFDTFKSCCEVISDVNCFGLSPKRITVSTAGVVPSIDRLTKEGPSVNLAISLNAHSDEYRNTVMPVNRKYPIQTVVAAAKRFVDKTGNSLTFEYVVNHGANDTPEAIKALTKLLSGISCKLNCIPLNANPQNVGTTPEFRSVQVFADALFKKGIVATVRRSRGDDICGACGQLRYRARQVMGKTHP
jgi:23S rRNA (adenine2503-C2)-methyltransferase